VTPGLVPPVVGRPVGLVPVPVDGPVPVPVDVGLVPPVDGPVPVPDDPVLVPVDGLLDPVLVPVDDG